MTIIWKEIDGYETHYQISNTGIVKSLARQDRLGHKRKEKLLIPEIDRHGYKRVVLSINGKKKTWQVHRLVAIAFLPNELGLPVVNHIDEDPRNNNVTNLEWCTHKYNANHGTRNERMTSKLRVVRGRRVTNGKVVFDTISDASRSLNIARSNISACVRGLQKTAGGYKWRYVND